MHKINHRSKIRMLTRSIMGLFGSNKRNITLKNHPNIYYKHVYFPKNLYEGIELIALMERTSKKEAAELLVKAGLSRYMGEKLAEHMKNEREAREQDQKLELTRFVRILRRYAKERGMDISKFI